VNLFRGDAVDRHALLAAAIAADDAHGPSGDTKRGGEKPDEGDVGGVVDRRRGDAHDEDVILEPRAFRFAGSRDDADVERDHPTILRA